MKYVIPVLFLIILLFAFIKKVKPYDCFIDGAKSAIPFAQSIFPYLLCIFLITELFEVSGVSAFLAKTISPFFNLLGIPEQLTKLVLIKPFSGSGALATVSEIYSTYGPDSYLARCASVIYGSSETVFYVASVYFAGCKNRPLSLPIIISLFAGLISNVFACFICRIL